MLLKPFNEASLWRGKLCSGQKLGLKPPMILPEIRPYGGTRGPTEPVWDEITHAYAVQSSLYWEGVKKRAIEYRAAAVTPTTSIDMFVEPTPPYRRRCLACM